MVDKKVSDFAQLPATDMHTLWNNDHYQSGRALFSPEKADRQIETICDGCDIFAKFQKPSAPVRREAAKAQPMVDQLVQISDGSHRIE